ncbi:MAG: alkene reductase, partial [Gammaproteobacteria bacterium]|nr:alkene reductase [Gammaproteobacteria bacterium]
RNDEYGGEINNRMRLLKEVLEAVIDVWGADHVGVRLSPENRFNSMSDSHPQATFNAVATMLSNFSLAYLHVLEGDMLNGDSYLDYAQIRQAFNGVYMANNGYDFERATDAIKNNQAQLVAFGQLYIANPDLAERFARGAPLNAPDASTFYGGDAAGYTDYPFME